jgi:hypothetical protein
VIDPYDLFLALDWTQFLASDANGLRRAKSRGTQWYEYLCMGVVALCAMAYLVLDVMMLTTGYRTVGGLVARLLLSILIIPFGVSANLTTLMWRWSAISRVIKRWLFIGLALYVAITATYTGFAVYVTHYFKPMVLSNFTRVAANATSVTVQPPAALCEFTVQNWTLLELAGLALLPHSIADSDTIDAIFLTIFPPTSVDASWMLLDRYGVFPYVHAWKFASPAIAFQGLSGRHQIAFLLENAGGAVYNSVFALAAPLPFFHAVRRLFLGNFLRDCGLGLAHVIGFGNATGSALNDTAAAVQLWAHDDPTTPVLAGHRPAGLLVKALAVAYNTTAVALETLDLYASLVWRNVSNGSRLGGIVNVATTGSLLVSDSNMDEDANNVDLAGKEKWFAPDDPYATFCRIAAACVADDRFDRLCNATVGMERYTEYFTAWKRPRAGRVR